MGLKGGQGGVGTTERVIVADFRLTPGFGHGGPSPVGFKPSNRTERTALRVREGLDCPILFEAHKSRPLLSEARTAL